MAKAFSVVSWNVKHFKGSKARMKRVVKFLKDQNPDIFALYEVTGKTVFDEISKQFEGYHFQITEGQQTQEILVGAKNSLDTFITQRTEFKAGTTHMRPGQLMSVNIGGKVYSLLFLHLASSSEPRGMGLRDDMLYRAVKFRHTLDKVAGGKHKANYIFMGDLNIMGLDYPYNKDIEPDIELKKWNSRASGYYGMAKKDKTHETTWSSGSKSKYKPANLDHVFAVKHLKFRKLKNPQNEDCDVDVRGWVNEKTATDQDKWIKQYSDHSLLYFEVQKV
jgi:exonuclease III